MLIEVVRNGRRQKVNQKVAEILVKKGIAQLADEAPELAFPGTSDTRTIYDVDAEIKAENAKIAAENTGQTDAQPDGLDDLDRDQLHTLAKERGVKVHHMAGADKVRAALREAAK